MTAELKSQQLARFARALRASLACCDMASTFGGKVFKCQKRPLLTALSGGADSTALALLAEQYAQQTDISHRAIVVDHGLRSGSTEEARRVVKRMQHFGIDTIIRRVTAVPPTGGIQNWARKQRYRILTASAREMGAVLLLGHHKADQAETVFMRLSRGSGLAGLGGMGCCRIIADTPVLRPLLNWQPDELSTFCSHFGCDYEFDPSNNDERFERVRVRAYLKALSSSGEDLSNGLTRLSAAARAICYEVDAVMERQLELPELFAEGYAAFSLSGLRRLPDILWRRVVGETVLAVGGGDYFPSQKAFSLLRSRLESGVPATLGGCRFIPRDRGTYCRVLKELDRNKQALVQIRASVPVIYAGVWRLFSPVAGCVQTLGDAPAPAQWKCMPHALRRAFPTIKTLDGRVLYPHFTERNGLPHLNGGANATFLALERMGALVRLTNFG